MQGIPASRAPMGGFVDYGERSARSAIFVWEWLTAFYAAEHVSVVDAGNP